jgi:hypothetical protein
VQPERPRQQDEQREHSRKPGTGRACPGMRAAAGSPRLRRTIESKERSHVVFRPLASANAATKTSVLAGVRKNRAPDTAPDGQRVGARHLCRFNVRRSAGQSNRPCPFVF